MANLPFAFQLWALAAALHGLCIFHKAADYHGNHNELVAFMGMMSLHFLRIQRAA